MSELLEQQMRQLKLGGMAKEWRSIEFHDVEQYVGAISMAAPQPATAKP